MTKYWLFAFHHGQENREWSRNLGGTRFEKSMKWNVNCVSINQRTKWCWRLFRFSPLEVFSSYCNFHDKFVYTQRMMGMENITNFKERYLTKKLKRPHSKGNFSKKNFHFKNVLLSLSVCPSMRKYSISLKIN